MRLLSKRLPEYLLTLLIIFTLNFLIPRIMPGDPFTFVSSGEDCANIVYTEEEVARLKAYYGLDKPIPEQFVNYLVNVLKGDFGYSIYFHEPVLSLMGRRLPYTLSIAGISLLLSCVIGCIIGCKSAFHRNKMLDRISYASLTVFSQVPSFLIGIVLLFFLAGKLQWFPLAGAMKVFAEYKNGWEKFTDIASHAMLPILTLTLAHIGPFYMLSRNSMLSVLTKDYMQTAKAKGLSKRRIYYVHALKNAVLPIITRLFLNLGTVFGGAVLVENVFSYPGLGTLMRQAINFRDYTLIQGIFLFFAICVLTMNLLADLVYRKLDPRISL